jgi:hypothetical protein
VRSLPLEQALRGFVHETAQRLHAELLDGAEVPFEVSSQASRRGQAPLYCYRPRTKEFLGERSASIARLPSHARARTLLEGFPGLDRYLLSHDAPRAAASGCAGAALMALLGDVFGEQSDFEVSPERLEAALARLERASCAGPGDVTLAATLHGLALSSPQLSLTSQLMIAKPDALGGVPEQALEPSWLTLPPGWYRGSQGLGAGDHASHLIAVSSTVQDESPPRAVGAARQALRELLRALRLFGDGRIALGPIAWARIGESPWMPIAPGWGGRPHGMLLVTAEHEDELRAFCNLVGRRTPGGDELAWALRRFELGCERAFEHEALSDYLLALRALLEPEGNADGLLAARLATLCATSEERAQLAERVLEAIALERAVIDGEASERARGVELTRELAGHLRALLRDVICGHLDRDLVAVADQLLLDPESPARQEASDRSGADRSGEEMLDDRSQSGEVVDVLA